MRIVQRVAEPIDLAMHLRTGNAVVDFLQEDEISLIVGDRLGHPLWPVATIKPADAFVNVVGEDAKTHGWSNSRSG